MNIPTEVNPVVLRRQGHCLSSPASLALMLSRQGEARDNGADKRLAWSLAGIAGALNTARFYAADL